MLRFTLVILFAATVAASLGAADRRAISPPGVTPVGPYSPGVLAGDYLYVSGQGAKRPDGTFPTGAADQLRQCLENIRAVVEAAGLKMDHVVYSTLYVRDRNAFGEVDRAWAAYFPKNGPARSMIGVASLPDNTPIEVNAVAVRNLSSKHAVRVAGDSAAVPAAVVTADRVYISDCRGAKPSAEPADEVRAALERMRVVLKAAGIGFQNMVFVNPYMTKAIGYGSMNRVYAPYFEFGNTPARATIEVDSLPGGINIEYTGIAVRKLSDRHAYRPKNMTPSKTASPCVLAGDTFYCSAKSGFIPGPQEGVYESSVENQVRQTMRNLLDGLEEAGMSFADVVATNVYLDDVRDFSKMNGIYKLYFEAGVLPARTTVQQAEPVERNSNENGRWPELEQISLVAVKR